MDSVAHAGLKRTLRQFSLSSVSSLGGPAAFSARWTQQLLASKAPGVGTGPSGTPGLPAGGGSGGGAIFPTGGSSFPGGGSSSGASALCADLDIGGIFPGGGGCRSGLVTPGGPLPGPLLVPPDSSTECCGTLLEGEFIACFLVGGEKRLCLPQVLNTVLRDFSLQQINAVCDELHIYCSRCAPSQLEVLKVTGVLPFAAPSCGLITKTDAERLVNALLYGWASPPGGHLGQQQHHAGRSAIRSKGIIVSSSTSPNSTAVSPRPSSPSSGLSGADKTVKVYHECFGRCKGYMVPELYTHSRAACVQCRECRLLFPPQRFVCHSHRGGEKRTCHWGFDSSRWRCYLLLSEEYTNRSERDALASRLTALKEKFEPQAGMVPPGHGVNGPGVGNKRPPAGAKMGSDQVHAKRQRLEECLLSLPGKDKIPNMEIDPIPSPRSSAFRPWSAGGGGLCRSEKEGMAGVHPETLFPEQGLLLNPLTIIPSSLNLYYTYRGYDSCVAPNIALAPPHATAPPASHTCSPDTSSWGRSPAVSISTTPLRHLADSVRLVSHKSPCTPPPRPLCMASPRHGSPGRATAPPTVPASTSTPIPLTLSQTGTTPSTGEADSDEVDIETDGGEASCSSCLSSPSLHSKPTNRYSGKLPHTAPSSEGVDCSKSGPRGCRDDEATDCRRSGSLPKDWEVAGASASEHRSSEVACLGHREEDKEPNEDEKVHADSRNLEETNHKSKRKDTDMLEELLDCELAWPEKRKQLLALLQQQQRSHRQQLQEAQRQAQTLASRLAAERAARQHLEAQLAKMGQPEKPSPTIARN
uniref:ski oncogene-like n=1 Tax=Myxine glutinosa TaxID=7769 RepID=UPI0035900E76